MNAFVVFLIVLATAQAIQGNVLQNEANEFFIGFGNNPSISQKTDLIISVTSSSQDTVMFTVDTLLGFTYSDNVSMGSPANVFIPPNFMVTDDSSSQRQKGIHVKAEGNKTIGVFGMNHAYDTTDAYLALPCNHLPVMQYEYYAASYDSDDTSNKYFVLLVGCENSTTVTTAESSFTLNRLETHLMYSSNTGTRVVTDKPVAFFSGNQCARVIKTQSPYSCGHLVEQLPPTSTWGTFFLGSTGFDGQSDAKIFYRVFAAHGETVVSVTCNSSSANPPHYTISMRGTYHDFVIDGTSPKTFCVIEASNPVLVIELQSIMGPVNWLSFMSLVPPTDQYNNHYSLPFGNSKSLFENNYVTITVPQQYFDRSKIYVDGSVVSTLWLSVKCSNGTICGYATTVSAGHFVQHLDRDARIGAIVFGTGEYDAYGSPAGFHVGSINPFSSSTVAPRSSAETLASTLQPVLTSACMSTLPFHTLHTALTSSARILLSTTQLQPVPTSKVPQPSYLSSLHFHTLHTVLPSSSQYKPTVSSKPAVSTTPEFSPSMIPTSSANSEHTTGSQTASVTPSVSPTPADPQPIAIGVLKILIPALIGIVFSTVFSMIVCSKSCFRRKERRLGHQEYPNYGACTTASKTSLLTGSGCTSETRTLLSADGSLGEEFGDPANYKECSDLPSSVHNPEQSGDNTHRDEAIQEPRRLTESDLFPLADILKPAAPKWKEIGGALGIVNSDLDIIENKPTLILEGVTGYFREMLSAWLKWAPPKHPWPTVQDLVNAVQRSGHENLAVKLQNYKITANHF